jgi:Tfp pilus assembly protein PilO
MEQRNQNPMAKKEAKKKLADYLKMGGEDQTTSIVVLIILISFALGYFIFMPISNGFAAKRIETANLVNEKSNLQEKQTVLKGLEKDLEQRASFISVTDDAMPTKPAIPELLITLSKLASDNSLYITNFAPKPEEVKKAGAVEEYSKVEIEFDVTGNYLNMKQFIKDMETNLRPINIVNINISGGGEISKETSTEILRFNVKCDVYYKVKNI